MPLRSRTEAMMQQLAHAYGAVVRSVGIVRMMAYAFAVLNGLPSGRAYRLITVSRCG